MFFINFTITTITIGVKYLIIIELMSDRRSDRRVIEVIEEGLFLIKMAIFEHFLRNYEPICINFRVKIMLIQQKHAQNYSKTI